MYKVLPTIVRILPSFYTGFFSVVFCLKVTAAYSWQTEYLEMHMAD